MKFNLLLLLLLLFSVNNYANELNVDKKLFAITQLQTNVQLLRTTKQQQLIELLQKKELTSSAIKKVVAGSMVQVKDELAIGGLMVLVAALAV